MKEEGRRLRRRVQGARSEDLQHALEDLDPELATWAEDFVFGSVWARAGLSFEERRIVALAALTVGGHTRQLRNYLHGALQDGEDPAKLVEVLLTTVVYAGFPSAIEGLTVLREVCRAHDRQARAAQRPGSAD